MSIADRQKIAWIIARNGLASSYGIDPVWVAPLKAPSHSKPIAKGGTVRRAEADRPDRRAGSRIAEFRSRKQPIERASGFVTLLSDAHARDKAAPRLDRGRDCCC